MITGWLPAMLGDGEGRSAMLRGVRAPLLVLSPSRPLRDRAASPASARDDPLDTARTSPRGGRTAHRRRAAGFRRPGTGQTSFMTPERPVVKRTARALLLDGTDLIVIKRTKPGLAPYWITPGGGVEPDVDDTVVAALHRELDEELGAEVTQVVPAFVDTVPHPTDEAPDGVKVQHFFLCRLVSMDVTRRHGPEVDEPCGAYDIVRIPLSREGVASVELVPPSLRAYVDRNVEGLRALLAPDLGWADPPSGPAAEAGLPPRQPNQPWNEDDSSFAARR